MTEIRNSLFLIRMFTRKSLFVIRNSFRQTQSGEIATVLTPKSFRGSGSPGGTPSFREFEGDINQRNCNNRQGKSDYCSSIGIPKIKCHNDLSNKIVIIKQSVPNSISAVKTYGR